ncbi:MAG: hypothetical protein CMJ42_01630 [Phyllobacteriaceae bacterium]|nr:hypothetical protein [Phyllobacteriaceae bacterium]MBA90466.1 hypothetical protein [Phyllobacteriaceae bacterium]
MMTKRSLAGTLVAVLLPALTACVHPWPPAARGGIAGQPAPTPEMAGVHAAVKNASAAGSLSPAEALAARERLDLAAREYRAGLAADADAGLLDVSLRLGGGDIATRTGRSTCLKAPCS